MTNDLQQQNKDLRDELEVLERELATQLQNNPAIQPLNYWLVLGTQDRKSQPVCINGKIYKNASLAAQALGFMKNQKPDKQKVKNRIARKTYNQWCSIQGSTLLKKVEVRDPRGKLLKYELFECGTVENIDSSSPQVTYYNQPKSLGILPLQKDSL